MRLGITLPIADPDGGPLRPTGIAEGARRLVGHGFESLWAFDAISRGFILPDPLIAVSIAATVTDAVEVGTCILQVPLRRPVELAHRVATAHLVAGDRLLLGVGAGSTEADFRAVGVDYGTRFQALADGLRTMRDLWGGAQVGDARLSPWPATVGGPKILIGSWAGGVWIKRAAREYDGWIASAAKTSFTRLAEGISRFRELGGRRAVVTNIEVDLSAPAGPYDDDGPFHLRCPADEASERLGRLAGLGFDDAVLFAVDQREPTLRALRELTTR
ncbi:MAG TPA: LLM class flavin-dependent oxidoreductase [Acidimicrobiales bacterium]|nr:LLM class flavin-dependent oxidoreductase [Acidimicrobiales bacterium]